MSGGGREPAGLEADQIAVIVIAKEPRPGKAKTRLIPALGERGAARLAEAALADTLDAVAELDGDRRRVLVLDGDPGEWLPAGFEVIPQRGDGLAERLAAAFDDVATPGFLIGMDTPQIRAPQIEGACRTLAREGIDAVIGPADDGGWWGLGLRRPDRRAFQGVPMSSERTGTVQTARLRELGLRYEELEAMRDIDTIEDARAVAASAPGRRFARVVEREATSAGGRP